jgi:hypothetical protein
VKASLPHSLPFPWTFSRGITSTTGFLFTASLLTPDGAVHPLAAGTSPPSTLTLPPSPPGAATLLLTLRIGERAAGNHEMRTIVDLDTTVDLDITDVLDATVDLGGNHHERTFTLPLTILSHNPYIAGPPVRGADHIGRDADLARLHDKLRHGSIQLAGERRIGKTSLLHHLADAPPAGHVPIWLDAQELSDPASLRTWVTSSVRHHLSDAPADPADLLPYLRRLAESGRTPLLLVDEISHLQGLTARDAAWLRSLSTPATAVLAGSPFDWSRFFASLPDAAGSPFNHLQHVTLGPLTLSELRHIVARPGAVAPDEPALQRITELSGGRPYLAQLLCQAALDRAQREERVTLTTADVDAVAREALVTGLDHQHRKRWAELSGAPEVRQALIDHVRSGAPPPRTLYDALAEHGLFDGATWTADPAVLWWVREREAG